MWRALRWGGLGLLVAVGAAVVWLRLESGRSTPVSVGSAVARFRAQTALTTSPPPDAGAASRPAATAEAPGAGSSPTAGMARRGPLPEPGVYEYLTSGGESVDAFGGGRHAYPERTAVTVSPWGCGVEVRWDPLRERTEAWRLCAVEGGVREASFYGRHEFFHVSATEVYECEGAPRPQPATPGARFTVTCRYGALTTSVLEGRALGRERLTVDGTTVEVDHVRYEAEVSGVSTGTQTLEQWIAPDTGLIVRQVVATDTVQRTAIGRVHFVEGYRLDLLSLRPVR